MSTHRQRVATGEVIRNVRDVDPAERAGALRDLAKGAGGDPQLDEDMLRQVATDMDQRDLAFLRGHVAGLEADVGRLERTSREAQATLRARIADLEEQLAEAQHDAAAVREVSATVRAEDEATIATLSAKLERLREIEARAAKHAVASGTVIAALLRRLGIDEATIEGDELAAIDEVIDLDVERGPQGDYARLRVRVEPRVHDDG